MARRAIRTSSTTRARSCCESSTSTAGGWGGGIRRILGGWMSIIGSATATGDGTSRRVDFQGESRGWLEVVDDHDFSAFPSLTLGTPTSGTTAAFPSLPAATSATVSLSRMSLGGRARTEEQFPSLGGVGVGGGPSTSTGPGRSDASRPRALVSVRADGVLMEREHRRYQMRFSR